MQQAAKERLEAESKGKTVILLPENTPTTRDLRLDRIRVFHNDAGVVVSTPYCG